MTCVVLCCVQGDLRKSEALKRVKADEDVLGASRGKQAKGAKIRRPKVALGGLDADIYGGSDPFRGRRSSKDASAGKLRDFKDFDPLKRLRKGGKLGKGAFKSKGKFKRR